MAVSQSTLGPIIRVRRIDGLRAALLGLKGRATPGPGEALWLIPCRQVHSFGLSYPMDIIHLDQHGVAVSIQTLQPWRLGRYIDEAESVLEMRRGEARRLGIEKGVKPNLILVKGDSENLSQRPWAVIKIPGLRELRELYTSSLVRNTVMLLTLDELPPMGTTIDMEFQVEVVRDGFKLQGEIRQVFSKEGAMHQAIVEMPPLPEEVRLHIFSLIDPVLGEELDEAHLYGDKGVQATFLARRKGAEAFISAMGQTLKGKGEGAGAGQGEQSGAVLEKAGGSGTALKGVVAKGEGTLDAEALLASEDFQETISEEDYRGGQDGGSTVQKARPHTDAESKDERAAEDEVPANTGAGATHPATTDGAGGGVGGAGSGAGQNIDGAAGEGGGTGDGTGDGSGDGTGDGSGDGTGAGSGSGSGSGAGEGIAAGGSGAGKTLPGTSQEKEEVRPSGVAAARNTNAPEAVQEASGSGRGSSPVGVREGGRAGSGGGDLPGQDDGVQWGQGADGLRRAQAREEDRLRAEEAREEANSGFEPISRDASRKDRASGHGATGGTAGDSAGTGGGSGDAAQEPIFAPEENSFGDGGGLGLGLGEEGAEGGGAAASASMSKAADGGATMPKGSSDLAVGDSKLGQGDDFWQTEQGMDSLRNRIQRLGRFRKAWESLEKRKVLVADSDMEVREYFKTIFERAGFEVEIAVNGDEALQLYFMHDIKLLVIDFHLERKDGIEVAREALEVARVPTIFMSKMTHDEKIVADLKRYGVDWILKKPFSNETIKPVLKEAIGAALLQDSEDEK